MAPYVKCAISTNTLYTASREQFVHNIGIGSRPGQPRFIFLSILLLLAEYATVYASEYAPVYAAEYAAEFASSEEIQLFILHLF